MKISNLAKLAIRGTDGTIQDLASTLKVAESTIERYLRTDDDALTKAAAIKVITKRTGLTYEQILEENGVAA